MREDVQHIARLFVDHRQAVHAMLNEQLDGLEQTLAGVDMHERATVFGKGLCNLRNMLI